MTSQLETLQGEKRIVLNGKKWSLPEEIQSSLPFKEFNNQS